MYLLISALILALLAPSGSGHQVQDGPACRAQLQGQKLMTTVELPGGVRFDAPWSVVHRGEMKDGQTHFVMVATLDQVIERDPVTGDRKVIPFPQPVSLAFEGPSQDELVQRAARVWCVTVMRAQENQALDRIVPSQRAVTRIAVLPISKPRA